MRTLVAQLEESLGSGFYYLSLVTALTVPDICGALDSEDGRATGSRYADWFEEWARPQFMKMVKRELPDQISADAIEMENPLTGEDCYRFRCSLLHQGTSQHPKSSFSRIIFIEPGATTNVVHYGALNDALCIDLERFCREIICGVRDWLEEVEDTERFRENYDRFARRHPDGLKPYIRGVPVVG